MWMYLGLLSALFLGLHSLCKKHAVQGNEVFPVLLGTISSGFLLILPLYIGSLLYPEYMSEIQLYITDIPCGIHGFILIKSAMMAGSLVIGISSFKTFTYYYCYAYTLCRSFFYVYWRYYYLSRKA